MPDRIVLLSLVQFKQLLSSVRLSRAIKEVHVHHTWRPRGRDFRGLATIEGMRRVHMQDWGWSDIAQHLTIDPAGGLWTGRNWNRPPASQRGANGTSQSGPFMIEMIGDFDEGKETFGGAQRSGALEVVAALLHRFGLDGSAIKFHRDLPGARKSCPGSAIKREEFLAAVAQVRETLGPTPRGLPETALPASIAVHLLGAGAARDPGIGETSADDEIPEDLQTGRRIEEEAAERVMDLQRRARRIRPLGARTGGERWPGLRPHVVNLALGQLSAQGEFTNTPADLQNILNDLEDYCSQTDRPRLMLHAHGGLVDEHTALSYADRMEPWWLSRGVYPVYFVWESGLLDILRQYLLGRRDLADWTTDLALEVLLKAPGTLAWGGMKKSARLASSADAGQGYPGGAYLFAEQLAERFLPHEAPRLEVHAVGHSAGSIFHAHLLPLLTGLGFDITSLHLLAPAIRLDLFKANLLPLLKAGRIKRMHLFTMDDEAERADDCLKVYRKSLLYLVSRSFESLESRPLLGLKRSLDQDPEVLGLFQPAGGTGAAIAEEQLSVLGDDAPPNPATEALRHGDFDNDPATVISVLRRVLALDASVVIDRDGFPFTLEPRSLDDLSLGPTGFAVAQTPPANGSSAVAGSGGARRALCVGIDEYAERPLAGCVADAEAWGSTLERSGFQVQYLRNGEATHEGILSRLDSMIAGATSGDVLVFQYAGHGTQLEDENGDESDRFDEALVPIDYTSGAFLLDDDLARSLARLPAGVQLTLFMDCCHSGTNSRFAPPVRPRTNAVERVRYLPANAEMVAAHRAFRRSRGEMATPAAEESAPGVIHIAACQDQEYAWETAGHGDFTTSATQRLTQALARGEHNEQFLDAVRQELARRGRQNPMMMSPVAAMRNRPLLAALALQ